MGHEDLRSSKVIGKAVVDGELEEIGNYRGFLGSSIRGGPTGAAANSALHLFIETGDFIMC